MRTACYINIDTHFSQAGKMVVASVNNFKGVEFDSFLQQSGANAFTLSPQKWIEATNAVGIISKALSFKQEEEK